MANSSGIKLCWRWEGLRALSLGLSWRLQRKDCLFLSFWLPLPFSLSPYLKAFPLCLSVCLFRSLTHTYTLLGNINSVSLVSFCVGSPDRVPWRFFLILDCSWKDMFAGSHHTQRSGAPLSCTSWVWRGWEETGWSMGLMVRVWPRSLSVDGFRAFRSLISSAHEPVG